MVDYTNYDALLIEQIAAGFNTAMVLEIRMSDCAMATDPMADGYRMLDKRLTATKKKGLIEFNKTSRRWVKK
jgi:hypothetical protein